MSKPYIPEKITVHLGHPDEEAENVTINFSDYIKNVASSEIYPTWPDAALRANIYSIISFALNRVYTEWYRKKGYGFDITSLPEHDQAYEHEKAVFQNISQIVDEIFNNYITKSKNPEPLFTEFCNGTTEKNKGMSQWGTVELADKGLTAYEILQHYYGNDISIVRNAPIKGSNMPYPGTPLGIGSSSLNVNDIQAQLNSISSNYTSIPKIKNSDGIYNNVTGEAVKAFQKIFNLNPTGVVDKATWYRINNIYKAVNKLSELSSDGMMVGEIPQTYPNVMKKGDDGNDVLNLQYILNIIGFYTPKIPLITKLGVYDDDTTLNVQAFQQYYGLPKTGEINEDTLKLIKKVYNSILLGLAPNCPGTVIMEYPGYALSEGFENNDVKILQTYLNVLAEKHSYIPIIPVTGYYGPQTTSVVKDIQKVSNLPITGYVDIKTWKIIADEYAKLI